jgi:hypothetical protein
LLTIPVAPVITGMTKHFMFHILWISILRFLYFNFFSASFCITFLALLLLLLLLLSSLSLSMRFHYRRCTMTSTFTHPHHMPMFFGCKMFYVENTCTFFLSVVANCLFQSRHICLATETTYSEQ